MKTAHVGLMGGVMGLVVGAAAGYAFAPRMSEGSAPRVERTNPASRQDSTPSERGHDEPERPTRPATPPVPSPATAEGTSTERSRPLAVGASLGVASLEEARAQLEELEAAHRELFGSPIPARDADHLDSRFARPALSVAFRNALEAEGVGGDVEAVDCAEHPCIVFGRLVGDEEDVEELERSPALAQYQDDVLTLLLWAVSVDDEDRERGDSEETALFAMAFYSQADRANRAEQLDRRIRARVLEVWNSDRPGPDPTASHEE